MSQEESDYWDVESDDEWCRDIDLPSPKRRRIDEEEEQDGGGGGVSPLFEFNLHGNHVTCGFLFIVVLFMYLFTQRGIPIIMNEEKEEQDGDGVGVSPLFAF